MQKHKAFSLVEMGIVLCIILIIIAGILSGASLTQTGRIIGARSATAQAPVPQINGLVAWYETSTKNSLKIPEAYNDGQISTWYDISPSSITAKRNSLTKTASSHITYTDDGINSFPTIQFNGTSSSKLTLPSFYQGTSPQNTVFLVFKMTEPFGATSHRTLLDSDTSGSTASIGISATSVTINAGSEVSGTTTIDTGTTYITAAYFNGSSSQIYLNDAATPIGTSLTAGSNVISGLTVGTTKSGTEAFVGLISEIIIYNRILKIQERRDVFRYLGDKYKVTVGGV